MDESRGGSRIVYPKLFAPLTKADLASQFRKLPSVPLIFHSRNQKQSVLKKQLLGGTG
jgi:hypothetical protein